MLKKNPTTQRAVSELGIRALPSSSSTAQRNPIEGKKEAVRGLGKPGEAWGGEGWGSPSSSSQLAQGTLTAGNKPTLAGFLKTLFRV